MTPLLIYEGKVAAALIVFYLLSSNTAETVFELLFR